MLNFVAAWKQVSEACVIHSWRALTPQFCRREDHPAPVSAANLAQEVATVAQGVPGSSRVTAQEVMETAEAVIPSTVEDVVVDVDRTEEEEASQQERQQQQERERAGRRTELSGRCLSKILSLVEQAKQYAEDVDHNNDRLLRFIVLLEEATKIYEPLHRELTQKSRQALISAYFTRQVPAADEPSVEEAALEVEDLETTMSDDEVASIVSDADFDGFI